MKRRTFLEQISLTITAIASSPSSGLLMGARARSRAPHQPDLDPALRRDWLARWEKNILGDSRNRYCDKEMGEELGWQVEAYSIVEQGKVGLIVSAKPEDRRLLIEEAAGITKFKSRKKQAEKKMELTQQNLLRVSDIIAEIERNIVSLRRQAAKAERFVAYRGELEDLQLHEAAHRYLELVGWTKLEASTCQGLFDAHDRAKADVHEREVGIDSVRREVESATSLVEKAQASSFVADNAIHAEQAAIQRAGDRIASLTQRAKQGAVERSDMTEQSERLNAERESLSRALTRLEEEERQQSDRLAGEEATLARSVEAHSAADQRLATVRQEVASARAQIAGAESALAAFERRHADLSLRAERLHAERESLETTHIAHQSAVGEIDLETANLHAECRAAAHALASLESHLVIAKDCVREEEQRFERIQGQLAAKKSRYVALEEVRARLDGVGAGTKALLGTKDSCLAGLLSDHIEATAEIVPALAGLLGARLEDVVVRDMDSWSRTPRGARNSPTREGGDRSAARAIHCSVRLAVGVRARSRERGFSRDCGPIGGCRSIRSGGRSPRACGARECSRRSGHGGARRLRDDGVRVALVTLGGEVLRPDGRIEGGQGDVVAAAFLESHREMRELAAQIEELQAIASQGLAALEDARSRLMSTNAAVEDARRHVHASEMALLRLEKDRQKKAGELEIVARRLENLTVDEFEVSQALAASSGEREQSERALLEGQSRVEEATLALARDEGALEQARRDVDAHRQLVTSSKIAIAATREKLMAQRGTANRLMVSARELDERAMRLAAEMDQNAEILRDAQADIERHRRP